MATLTSSRPILSSTPRDERPTKRKKDQRTEIWSNLLRQTREAQARSRTQAVQARELIVCGGSAEDQRAFIHSLARPPSQAPANRSRNQRLQRPKGEVRLSNTFAYGYGHVTLYSPPAQQGSGFFGNESEEIVKLELHTFPGEADKGFEHTLRRLLNPSQQSKDAEKNMLDDGGAVGNAEEPQENRPAACLLLSWKEPWTFLNRLRLWLQLLSHAILSSVQARQQDDPVDVIKEAGLQLTVVIQHVEAQDMLEREEYREETFDSVSQYLRTCLLPLGGGLIYVPSSAPPQPLGGPLTEIQKIVYTSLNLDLAPLSPKSARPGSSSGASAVKKEELAPKHNVVDRMAIVVPSGWDSVGKIRLLSETFSPEAVLEGWMNDINVPLFRPPPSPVPPAVEIEPNARDVHQADGGAEVFETSSPPSPYPEDVPMSPSKIPKSAIMLYEQQIQDPHAHRKPAPPRIEVTTKPEQIFLGEMRSQLQTYEAHDAERAKQNPNLISTTAGSLTNPQNGPSGALSEHLGDVSFNVGGVSYNTVTAEAAINRLKSPHLGDTASPSSAASTPRTSTPRPPRRDISRDEGATPSASAATPSTTGPKSEMNIDKLEEYFHSLMKRGGGTPGGSGSAQGTPSKPPTQS